MRCAGASQKDIRLALARVEEEEATSQLESLSVTEMDAYRVTESAFLVAGMELEDLQ